MAITVDDSGHKEGEQTRTEQRKLKKSYKEEELWVIGGNGPPEVLDFVENEWIAKENTQLENTDLVIYNSENPVLIHRGESLLSWNCRTYATKVLTKLPLKIERFAHAHLHGKVYLMGGIDEQAKAVQTWQVYDTCTGRWSKAEDMKRRSSGRNAVVVDGKMYVTPGKDDQSFNRLDCLDPESGNWEAVSKMNVDRACHALAEHDGQIWAFGGNDDDRTLEDVECYDIRKNNWEERCPMNIPRENASVTFFKGKFYVIGGEQRENGRLEKLNVVEIYDPENDSCGKGPSLKKARAGHCSVVLKTGPVRN